jgi:predicted glycosyltransferase
LFAQFPTYNFAVVGGSFSSNNVKLTDNVKYFNYLNDSDLWELINLSEQVLSRSGYSSVMDYYSTQMPVIYVPTPGQSEQEYIAKQLKVMYLSKVISQEKILTLNFL